MASTEVKIKEKNELIDIVHSLKKEGKIIVTTNGAFDLLHVGHVNLLEKSAELGDVLVVLVNSDDSVRRYKGDSRPVISLAERMRILAAIGVVSYVSSFDEDTPVSYLQKLSPDVHTKGGDYAKNDLPEAEVVEMAGGKVVLLPNFGETRTSRIIKKIEGQ